MTEAEHIAAEQLAWWMREGLCAKTCLVALGRPARGTWADVFFALVGAAMEMTTPHPRCAA